MTAQEQTLDFFLLELSKLCKQYDVSIGWCDEGVLVCFEKDLNPATRLRNGGTAAIVDEITGNGVASKEFSR